MKNKDLPEGNTHYVDNKRFQVLMVERKALVDSSETPPRISNEIGEIFLKIATNLSFHRYFINYTFTDEMIGDAIENCVKYIDNYDCEKYSNPFAYFTQICYYAFQRRKAKEKKRFDGMKEYRDNVILDEEFHDKWDFQNSVVDDFYKDPNPPEPEAEGDDNSEE